MITREQFLAYEVVQESGVTNMWDWKAVQRLSGGMLEKGDIAEIEKNYRELAQQYDPQRYAVITEGR